MIISKVRVGGKRKGQSRSNKKNQHLHVTQPSQETKPNAQTNGLAIANDLSITVPMLAAISRVSTTHATRFILLFVGIIFEIIVCECVFADEINDEILNEFEFGELNVEFENEMFNKNIDWEHNFAALSKTTPLDIAHPRCETRPTAFDFHDIDSKLHKNLPFECDKNNIVGNIGNGFNENFFKNAYYCPFLYLPSMHDPKIFSCYLCSVGSDTQLIAGSDILKRKCLVCVENNGDTELDNDMFILFVNLVYDRDDLIQDDHSLFWTSQFIVRVVQREPEKEQGREDIRMYIWLLIFFFSK